MKIGRDDLPLTPSEKRKQQLRSAPLREVVGTIMVSLGDDGETEYFVRHELLQCFHHQRVKEDLFGSTNARRRRCLACKLEADAGGQSE